MRNCASIFTFAIVTIAAVSAACSSTNNGNNGSTSGADGGGGSSSGNVCYSVPVNTEDGTAACGGMTCSAGQYCDQTCINGCTATNNCAKGEYCDLSNPSASSLSGAPVGTCHVPGSDKVIACTSGGDAGSSSGCGDVKPAVDGAYKLTLDTAGSTAVCANAFPASTCTVTQNGCALTWSCSPNLGFGTSTLDDTGKSTVPVSIGGQTGTCAVTFDYIVQSGNTFLTFDCQSSAGTQAVDCKGSGSD